VAVAADGSVAAVGEPQRITLLALPDGVAFAEIGVDPEAHGSEVGWLGAAPRLLVLSRYAAYSTAHLLDPQDLRPIAEIRLETPMRLYATVGATALVVGGLGAAVLAASDTHLTAYPFPTRTVPITAGAAAGQFVVALSASIEEWDPQSRMPRRRLRLPRAAAITAVGGSERLVWMTTQQEPARIDVIPLVNRGQPRGHDLPEPIAAVSGHPRSDLVACIGAETGRVYVIDLDGRHRLRILSPDGGGRIESAAMVIGRMTGVLAAQPGRAVMIAALDGRDDAAPVSSAGIPLPAVAAAGPPARLDDPGEVDPGATEADPARLDDPAALAAPPTERGDPALPWPAAAADLDPPAAELPRAATVPTLALSAEPLAAATAVPLIFTPALAGLPVHAAAAPGAAARAPAAGAHAAASGARFSAWRELAHHGPASEPPAPSAPPGASPAARVAGLAAAERADRGAAWRDDVVGWTRAITAGGVADPAAPDAPLIEALIARFDLAAELHPALVLLYGAHLCGERGAAPAEVAHVLDGRWDEALGRGELAERGVAEYAGSRVALSAVVLRVLDELPPATGVLVGEPGRVVLLGPCVVVAGDEPLVAIAARCAPQIGGAILAATGAPPHAELVLEARARGAAPMLRAAPGAVPGDPAIFVVEDPELAERLGVPRLA